MVLGRRELSAILLAVAAILFYLVLLSTTPSEAQDSNCPGAEEVDTFTGTGDRQTAPFEITGNVFQVTSEVTATGDPDFLFFSISVRDENGDTVTTIDQEQPGTESSFVNEGPGQFFLDILAANAEYTITVEDCTGTDQNNGNQTTQNQTTRNPTTQNQITDRNDSPQRQRRPQRERTRDVINVPNRPLPPSGGLPVYGVVGGFVLAGAGLLALGVVIRRRTQG